MRHAAPFLSPVKEQATALDESANPLRVVGHIRTVNRSGICGSLTDRIAPDAAIRIFLRIGDHSVAETSTLAFQAPRQAGSGDNFRFLIEAPIMRRRLSRAIAEALDVRSRADPYLRCHFADGECLDLSLFDEEEADGLGLLGFDRLNGRDLYAAAPVVPEARAPLTVDVICFYLPQFHPIKENDAWWGPGFTEWVNVARAQKQFASHNAPWLPADLGFYDLRLKEARARQADLAKQYGVAGFCYYVYWFQGRRLLERPLQLLLEDGEPDMPFCLCWANENWSRRWDGSDAEVLMAQQHDLEADKKFIDDMAPWLADERHIRVNGKLVLLIYRPSSIPSRAILFEHWRQRARDRGLGELLICNVMTFGEFDPRPLDCDAAVEFPPHTAFANELPRSAFSAPASYEGSAYDYAEVVRANLGRSFDFGYFPGVMPRWDNTPRKGAKGNVFINSSPDLFEIWLRDACRRAQSQTHDRKLVFVNSWNEWAEGAHVEPDSVYGRAFLDAIRRVTSGASSLANLLRTPDAVDLLSREEMARALRQSLFFNETLGTVVERTSTARATRRLLSGLPEDYHTATSDPRSKLTIERLNDSASARIAVPRGASLSVRGTSFVAPGFPARHGRTAALLLQGMSASKNAHHFIEHWHARPELADDRGSDPAEIFFGFECRLQLEDLAIGEYQIRLIEFGADGALLLESDRLVEIVR